MMNVFQEFQDVLALKSTELGRTNLVEHEIDVVRLPPRRIPLHKVSAVEQALAEMEEKEII